MYGLIVTFESCLSYVDDLGDVWRQLSKERYSHCLAYPTADISHRRCRLKQIQPVLS